MDNELLEGQETVDFDESLLMNLSNAAARFRHLQLLNDTYVVVVNRQLQKRPRQMELVMEGQVKNDAGGFVFPVSDETIVRRFLIIGTDNGTYYESAKRLTMSSVERIIHIIENGKGHMVLRELSLINAQNRNPKMNSMLFTLAVCSRIFTHDTTKKNACPLQSAYSEYILELHASALRLLPYVCRTPTHLFEFIEYCETIAEIRALDLVEAYLQLKNEQSEEAVVVAIKKHGLVREHLPTASLNSKLVWETLFDVPMPLTALIRNLGKMTLVGALDESRVGTIVKRLTDQNELRRARIHPISLLIPTQCLSLRQTN